MNVGYKKRLYEVLPEPDVLVSLWRSGTFPDPGFGWRKPPLAPGTEHTHEKTNKQTKKAFEFSVKKMSRLLQIILLPGNCFPVYYYFVKSSSSGNCQQ